MGESEITKSAKSRQSEPAKITPLRWLGRQSHYTAGGVAVTCRFRQVSGRGTSVSSLPVFLRRAAGPLVEGADAAERRLADDAGRLEAVVGGVLQHEPGHLAVLGEVGAVHDVLRAVAELGAQASVILRTKYRLDSFAGSPLLGCV